MKINLRQFIGGVPGLLEEDYERESFLSSVKEESGQNGKLAIGGKTELNGFNKTQADKEGIERQRRFYQDLKEDTEKAQQRAKEEPLLQIELDYITTNLPTEEKNKLLHYQANYKNNRSIYSLSELRKKIIEESSKADKKQKEVSIPSPAKQPSALEGAFEGRSGTQGSGTANLSAHATG